MTRSTTVVLATIEIALVGILRQANAATCQPSIEMERQGPAIVAAAPRAQAARDQLFDNGWRFLRGDAPGAADPAFDDSQWRALDLPHDWSIEDLPPPSNPEVDVVTGQWRFNTGDNAAWSAPSFDDSAWQQVTLPVYWEDHSNYTADNVYGWFRRALTLPPEMQGQDVDLLVGRIDDVDEVFLNGVRIGGLGSFPPNYVSAWNVDRRCTAAASLWIAGGPNILAVRVFDGTNGGGIYQAGHPTRIGPFDAIESEGKDKTGWVLGGVGWYRKTFRSTDAGKQVAVRFDGVYMGADVWINGTHLGHHPYGYTSFEYDLTPHLSPPGWENVLAVRVNNAGKNSRWYSGSGIYRHVWLTTTAQVYIPTWGVFVTTPTVSTGQATVQIDTEVHNATAAAVQALVRVQLRDAAGVPIGSPEDTLMQLPAGETQSATESISVPSPSLWSPDTPTLYSADVEIIVDNETVDAVTTAFGIRQLEVDAANGLRLNGQPILLKGGCIHHDNGPLGAAAIDRAEVRRIELMKANGFNAVRSSHNPPSPAFLDACDRLGLLVIDEAFDQWNVQKLDNSEDYHLYFSDWYDDDIASMVRRVRNHSSVIMWSIGNEIPEQFNAESTQLMLRNEVLSHDSTRPITQAVHRSEPWDTASDAAFTHLDVAGYNYLPDKYESDHVRQPDRIIIGAESYPKDAYDYWSLVEQHPYIIGDFVWTSMDYLGESGLAHAILSNEVDSFFMPWPWHNAWCGDLDICGFKKPQSYYRDVLWGESQIEMMVHRPIPAGLSEIVSWWGWPDEIRSWNWAGHEGESLQVSVYSSCEAVRLELNGNIVGQQSISAGDKLTASFPVPYAAGELRAIGLISGQEVAETTLETTGPATELKLTADRTTIAANRNDLCYVTVEVVDDQGRRVPDAELPITFTVTGVGNLAGQANGAPNKPASFQAPECTSFRGRCLAILRPTGATGQVMLQADAPGLQMSVIMIQCEP